jgi:phenylpropionate dioxygenase-like ring-hydroxylating dioxygenase large terminal subunit
MTEDQVALDDWYPVADAVTAGPVQPGAVDAFTTRLLGHPIRVAFAGDRARLTALRGDGHELRELPVVERFGLVWTTLGTPAKDVYDLPEAAEPDRRYVRCGWVTLRTSAPRIVENFLDMAHFPFVHPGVLGAEPWTEVPEYDAEIRRDVDEVWATNCKFFQPRVAATEPATESAPESDSAYAALTYRVPAPFQVMLYRVCPTAPGRLDAILLAVHPVDEHLCRAQPVEYLVDDHSPDNTLLSFEQAIFLQDRFIVENQRPLSLPLGPGAEIPVRADGASTTYRRWLREKKLTFGVLT